MRLILDWVWVVVVVAVMGIVETQWPPAERQFFLEDRSIAYPHMEETISTGVLVVIGGVVPLAVLAIGAPVTRIRVFLSLMAALGFCLACTVILTDVCKNLAGRLRPDFLARCKIDESKIRPSSNSTSNPIPTYYTQSICTGNEEDIADGRRSFPSGHASFSAAGCFFVIFVLHRFAASSLVPCGAWTSKLTRPVLQLVLAALALGTACTRVADNHHNISDIIPGALLGIAVAFVSSHVLLSTPIARATLMFEQRRKEEEEEEKEFGKDKDGFNAAPVEEEPPV